MKEKDIQTTLSKVHDTPGVFELKLCKGKSIRFDSVKEHQVDALIKASSGEGLFHKISDFPMFKGSKMRFNKPKPFDFFYLNYMPAFVIVCFYEQRKKKKCYYVSISCWIGKQKESKKKSITEEEVKKICTFSIDLKNKA